MTAVPHVSLPMLPPPDWTAPLNLEDHLATVPPHLKVKGMSLNGVMDALADMGRPLANTPRVVAFKDHPMKDLVHLMVRGCRESFPELPPRETLRRMGQRHLDKLRDNLLFKVIFAGLGQSLSLNAAALLVPRAYAAATTHERGTVILNEKGRLRIHLDEVWTFPDAFHSGVFEGAVGAFGVHHVNVGVLAHSPTRAEIEVTWQP